MRRGAVVMGLLVLAFVLVGCGERGAPLPPVDVRIDLQAHARSVRPGEALTLDVVRTWKKGLDPSPWDDAFLSPLVVRQQSVERREDGRRIQERRRFRAYAFSLEDARVPAVPFAGRPSDGGELRIAASKPLRLRVVPEVDPSAPGPVERPGALPTRHSTGAFLLWMLGILLAGAAWLVVRSRRRVAPVVAPEVPGVPPETQAREALERLRAQGPVEPTRDALVVAQIVRTYAGARFEVDALTCTTEELDAATGAGSVLAPCDRVKFGGHVPTHGERDALIDAAEAYVERVQP